MKQRRFLTIMLAAALALAVGGTASGDDGAKTNKSMSQNIQLPDFDQEIVDNAKPEAEHAFTDMMGFYVPAQAASGLVGTIAYCDVDNEPTSGQDCINAEETLEVAKPLVNVFIYGPSFHVPNTAFAHRWFDTYAAVSLDDGETWKKTNLSESADKSSFNIETDHNPNGSGSGDPLPGDHNIRLGNAFHAKGYETPYTAHCSECHGQGLQGVAQVPSCYSCHDNKWAEAAPVEIGPVIYMAELKGQDKVSRRKLKLKIEGDNAADSAEVFIINAITGHTVGSTEAEDNGKFEFNEKFDETLPPCVVYAEYTNKSGDILTGPSTPVVNNKTGEPIENCEGTALDVTDYPGGSYNVFHATAGNKTLVAWPSRYCQQGQPAYSFAYDGDDTLGDDDPDKHAELLAKRDAVEFQLNIDVEKDLYLADLFGVSGAQGSIDFADEGYPQAGVVPFGCVWTSRGVLLPGDDLRTDAVEESHMVWTKAERLTSGRRDPNRIEVKGVQGAGFVITWQEDPDGLRPGQGEGPGEGWSGAVAHDKTDVWYSFIPWEQFDLVEDPANPNGEPVNIVDHNLDSDTGGSGRPQVYVPMAVPMRLTNNDKCGAEYNPVYEGTGGITDPADKKYFSYCNHVAAASYGLQDFCANVVQVPQGPNDTLGPICVNEEGLPNIANTASTRPRLSLQGYSSQNDGIIDSAWVILAAEESKGLGRYQFLPNGAPCDEDGNDADNPDCGADLGKNQWYFSFDMGDPATSATNTEPYGLVQNLVKQGNLLNQPEVDWRSGEFYPVINTSTMWDFEDYNYELYNTEIARRASLLVQSIGKAANSEIGLLAIPSWKQGAMRQGGPADTMLRRILLPGGYTEGIGNNPYAFTNMECNPVGGSEGWILTDGSNPYYPDGICAAPATNLSGVVPDICRDDATGGVVDCPTVNFEGPTYGIGDTNPILQGYVQNEGNTTRVLTWHQCPSDGEWQDLSEIGTIVNCGDEGSRDDPFVNLKDQSWYNPLDVSKGHRGFLDGDFVMFLYAWSPNWRLNAKGNDRYDLYVRRSFDGAQTWGTTPSDFISSDGNGYMGAGTVTCETYRSEFTGDSTASEPHVCYDFGPGVNEHARNITQHQKMRTTTLDPRYAPAKATITSPCVDEFDPTIDPDIMTCDDESIDLDSDLRYPSRYFMVYETGDNSTVEAGEAEPLDLFYSRAESFGDDYVVWTETDSVSADLGPCYPSTPYGDEKVEGTVIEGSGFCNEFDRLNTRGDTHSSEANLEATPDGSKLYGVWTQWVLDDNGEEIIESDAMARRVWWIDDYISVDNSYTLPGTSGGSTQE